MSGQSKRASAAEALAGTAIGFGVSWAATPPILALFGYQASAGTAFGITVIYTVLSVVRGYLVRRLFNHLHTRPAPKPELFREASERGLIKRIGSNGLPPCPKPPPPPSPPRRRKWRDRW